MESTKNITAADIVSNRVNIYNIFTVIHNAAKSIPRINSLEKNNGINTSKILVPYSINGESRLKPKYHLRGNISKNKNIFKGDEEDSLIINPNAEITKSLDVTLDYDPDTITIMGGSALNIYSIMLNDYIKSKGIIELKDYVKRETTDIDIVWWPQYEAKDNKAIISASPIIKKYVENLTEAIKENIKTLEINGISELRVDNNINKKALSKMGGNVLTSEYKFGSYQIYIYGTTKKGDEIHLVDFTIHDTASGQRSLMNDIKPMEDDKTYINKDNIHTIEIGDKQFINIPKISSFITQQKYAFNNLPEKRSVYYYRLLYIEELLNNISSNINVDNLRRVFGEDITKNTIKKNLENLNKVNTTIQKSLSSERIDTLKKYVKDLELQKKELEVNRRHKILEIELPMRQYKRNPIKYSQQNLRNIKKNIEEKTKQYEEEYEKIIKDINYKIEKLEKQIKEMEKYSNLKIIEPTIVTINHNKMPPLLNMPALPVIPVAQQVVAQSIVIPPAPRPIAPPLPPQPPAQHIAVPRYEIKNRFTDQDGSIIELLYDIHTRSQFYRHLILDQHTKQYISYVPKSAQELHSQQDYLHQRFQQYLQYQQQQQQQLQYQGYPQQWQQQGYPMQQQGKWGKGKGKGKGRGGSILTRKKITHNRVTHKNK